MDGITIRAVHRHEWRDVKALRLRALQDEAAPIAFVDTFEEASLRADEFWQSRAAAASVEAGAAADARQFVAVASGTWVGSATALVERPGSTDFEGNEIYRPGIAIVGVYLAETHRGHGILPALLDAAVDWARELGLDHARLQVHVDNARARRAYERAGFRTAGAAADGLVGREIEMVRDISG